MLLSWHKYGGGKELLDKLYASVGANVVSFPYGPMPTQPLGWFKKPITKAEDFKGLKFRTVGISIDVFTGMGAAVNALPGGEIVPAMDRGLLDARRVQQRDLGPPARLPGRVQGVHAAELPPERRAVRDHVQQDEVRRAAREDAARSSPTRSTRLPPTCRGRRSTATRRTTSSCRRRTRSSSTRRRTRSCRSSSRSTTRSRRRRSARESAVQGDHRLAEGVRRARGASGTWTPTSTAAWRTTTTSAAGAGGAEEGLTPPRHAIRHHPALARMVFFSSPRAASRIPPGTGDGSMQKLLLSVDKVSTLVGQAFSWLIVALTLLITWEVFSRYVLGAPARLGVRRDDHDVRHAVHDGGRVHAGEERPRARRRALRLLPAAAAGGARPHALHRCSSSPASSRSCWAGYCYAGESWAINEHSNITADGPPIYPFKTVIPIAGALLLLQGIVEIIRCVICLQQGDWPSREEDVEEVDVDKLKEMVHVKDEDIEKLDALVVDQRRGARDEKGSLVRAVDHGGGRDRGVRADAGAVADDQRPPRPADAGADRGGDHARLPDRVHADGHGRDLRVARLPQRRIRDLAVRQTLDLMVQRAYAVMSNDVLISIPLFVFMGYLVERANLIEKLFKSLHLALARVPGSLAVATIVTCAVFATATGIVGAVVTLMGLLAFPAMLRAGYNVKVSAGVDHRRRLPRHPDSAVGDADRLRRDGGRVGGAALRRRVLPRHHAGAALHRLRDRPREAEARR